MKTPGLLLVAIFATTGAHALEYKPYFSIGGGYSDSRINISRGNASVSSNGLSLGAVAGVRMNQYTAFEVNGNVNQMRIAGTDSHSDLTFVSVMPGVRMGVKIGGLFYPYIGASVGPSWTINKYAVGDTSTKETKTTFAYQGRAGIAFNMGTGAGLDVGVRYVSLGHLKIDGTDFGIDGTVTSFNYYITASYGF